MQPVPPNKKIFNPMPESLNDTQVNPNDIVLPQDGQFGEIPEELLDQRTTSKRVAEINSMISTRLTDEMLNKEILDEKIRQDITSMKKDVKAPGSPKDVLKSLIAKGDYKENIELFGCTWTIKALSQGDIILAFNDINDDSTSTIGKVATLTISQIAFAIEACNGIPIYEWFPDIVNRQDFATTEDFKLAVRRIFRRYLEQMPSTVLNQFDSAYTIIEKKRNEALVELKKS
jgi:hypothetical protein